jgi:enoyl-CoA hydratase
VEPVILVERHGPVGWLIFNRPEAGNAMNAAMIDAIAPAWAELDRDPAVAAIVVTGAGRSFQTGLDVVQLSHEPEALREMSRRTRTADLRLTGWHLKVGKPIITAVNGVCAGGGLHFVADSDVVIASSAASFLDPHVSVGQVSALEGVGMVRRVAFGSVARMAFTGAHERLSAQRALELGWVSELVDPPDRLRERAQELAEQIGSNDAEALRATKRALWHAQEVGLRAARESATGAR